MKLASLSRSIPQFDWDGIRVSFAPHQVERLKQAGKIDLVFQMSEKSKVTTAGLAAEPGGYIACVRGGHGMTKVFDKIGASRVTLVWSMWSGYWTREGCAMREWAEREGIQPQFIHSGGHAWPDDLRRLVDAIAAGQTVWVHTDWDGVRSNVQRPLTSADRA